MFLLSLDEIDRVKRANHLDSTTQLAEATGLSRKTWFTALKTRQPTPGVLDALARLGAKPSKVLVASELMAQPSAA